MAIVCKHYFFNFVFFTLRLYFSRHCVDSKYSVAFLFLKECRVDDGKNAEQSIVWEERTSVSKQNLYETMKCLQDKLINSIQYFAQLASVVVLNIQLLFATYSFFFAKAIKIGSKS